MIVNDLIEYRGRDEGRLGEGWWWPKEDKGAWYGPSREFSGLRDLVLQNAPGRRVIVQAGGCCGMYPKLWANDFDLVVTAEPNWLNFLCLNLNCQDPRIIKLNAALSDRPGMVGLGDVRPENVGEYQVKPEGRIPALRIDDLGLDACDVISLDVEAHESKVLLGAMETIRRFQPVVTVETLDTNGAGILEGLDYGQIAVTNSDKVFIPRAGRF